MNIFALCAAGFERSVRRAAGVAPLLSPPASHLEARRLEGHDFLYFKLHGGLGSGDWLGDGRLVALSESQIRRADLRGATVFVANCYLPDGPMLDALLSAGAEGVVGGAGQNYARSSRVDGADLLGLYFRWMKGIGLNSFNALSLAKLRLRIKYPSHMTRDTLAFRLYTRDNPDGFSGDGT